MLRDAVIVMQAQVIEARPAKTQQKISGRLRSEQATRQRYEIRGYLSTASKHGINKLSASWVSGRRHQGMPPRNRAPGSPPGNGAMRRVRIGESADIRAILTAGAVRAFDMLEPSLRSYGVRADGPG